MTQIPGIKSVHAVVTDTCRANRTSAGAMDEAWARVRAEWQRVLASRKDLGVQYHLVLTVQSEGRD